MSVTAQGEFAGTKSKELIGKKFNNDRVLPGLEDYKYRQSTLASDSDDPEQFSVAVFQKGPTYLRVENIPAKMSSMRCLGSMCIVVYGLSSMENWLNLLHSYSQPLLKNKFQTFSSLG